ncbi:NAC domain protein [Melia azedarach]|uniref:NAC domain protein n=1 Tax=Melia azedarach TaxID=155640 RepID=A0ACC1WP11_MELAZ|nr:NAC domain protein [Melia azedarach]
METPSSLPSGCHFKPTDEELIMNYLLKKVTKQSLPSEMVHECDLYGDEKIWQSKFEDSGEKGLYFFANLRCKKTENGVRIKRSTASGGTWKAAHFQKIMYDQRVHVGSKRTFSYVAKQRSSAENKWTMTEYRLDGSLLADAKDSYYVLCQVRKLKNPGVTHRESGSRTINDSLVQSTLTREVEATGETSVSSSPSAKTERVRIEEMEHLNSDSGYFVRPGANAPPIGPHASRVIDLNKPPLELV